MKFPLDFREDREFDVISFGTNAVDFLIRVPEYPAFNSKVELTNYVRAAGGEAATTAAGLNRLGLRAAYAGRFGDDDAGQIGWDSLVDDGVEMRFAERIAGAQTQIAFIVIDQRSGERTVIWQRDPKLSYSRADAPTEAIELSRVLHFTPHDTDACREMARAARSAGTITSIDIDKEFPGVEQLLPDVDILVTSAEFLPKFIGLTDTRAALTEMRRRYGCAIAAVTLGSAGSLLLCNDSFVESPGFEVPGGCVDTTGAGDAFRVGLLYGLLTGESVEESCRIANAVAALKCRKLGARTALPNGLELKGFLK